MPLEIAEREMAPDITVVELTGKLELGRESQRIETMVDDLAKRGSTRVIFDMRGVDYMDSTGIGMLALASGKMREAGGSMAIVAPGGRVLEMLTLTQINLIVKVCPTVDAAAAALQESMI
jgi:anti-sigma B factor antagonist